MEITAGKVTALGNIRVPLEKNAGPERLLVTLSAGGTANSWNIRVYPANRSPVPKNVTVEYAFDKNTIDALHHVENVLLFSR